MNKIIFLLDELPVTKSANGICVEKILEVLKKDGFITECICWHADHDKVTKVNLIPEKPWARIVRSWDNKDKFHKIIFRILRILYKVKRTFLITIWPVDSLTTINSFYNASKQRINKGDIIVAVNYPAETLVAMKRLKKHFGDEITTIMYPLDVSFFNPYGNKIERAASMLFTPKFMKDCLKYADELLVLENALPVYNTYFKGRGRKKFRLCGIPLLKSYNIVKKSEEKSNSKELHFIYTGTIQKKIRDPKDVFAALDYIGRSIDKTVVFDIFGQIDDSSVEMYKKNCYKFRMDFHGWIDENYLEKCLMQSDILINIGNYQTNLIPSKLFKYMSTGKPILHFYFTKDDPCLFYLKKYGNALLISDEECKKSNLDFLVPFILERKDLAINIAKLFPRCTPQFTANILEKCLIDKKNGN